MKKSKKLICTIIALAVIAAAVVLMCISGRDKQKINGWFLSSCSGTPMLITDSGEAIILNGDNDDMFSRYNDGDKITVICGYILETYPSQTDVYFCFRTKKGSRSDIPKWAIDSLRELGWID